MANRITLPGILGAAAEKLGVSGFAKEVGTTPRTLYNWATNRSPTPGIPALRIAEICSRLCLKPMLYRMPGGGKRDCIASTPQGWIASPFTGQGVRRYSSVVDDPAPATAFLLAEALEFGWPWMGSARHRMIPVWVDQGTAYGLHALLSRAKEVSIMRGQDGVDDLLTYVANRLEEGMRSPGTLEGQVVASLFGI